MYQLIKSIGAIALVVIISAVISYTALKLLSINNNESCKYKKYYEYDVYKLHDSITGELTDSIIIPIDTIWTKY